MRWIAAALAALAIVPAGAAAMGRPSPHVWLVARHPAAVRGSSFAPAERIAVTLSVGDVTLKKTIVANGSGGFLARWSGSVPSGCVAVGITARGSSGSRVAYRLSPPECAPLQP